MEECHWIMGNEVISIDGDWYVKETGEKLTDEVEKSLICPKCNMPPTEEGHDSCIANLPNVMNVCCGHGVNCEFGHQHPYIIYEDGNEVRFDTTDELLDYVKEKENE